MQILRGEVPAPFPEIEDKTEDGGRRSRLHGYAHERKKRKRIGEDDTDFEMRVAHDRASSLNSHKEIVLRKPIDAPLVDRAGHIDLFPQERLSKPEKNAEAEKEAAKKKKEYEDQYTMRFSNAAGFKQGLESPWYSKSLTTVSAVEEDTPSKDVWGNEDPRRKERDSARIVSNDPLAAMRQGAAQVRQIVKERKRWQEEKNKELRELHEEERRRKRLRRQHGDDPDDLESFRLDGPDRGSSRKKDYEYDKERRRRHKESSRKSRLGESDDHGHRRRHHRHRN
jgi:hypothetical protein